MLQEATKILSSAFGDSFIKRLSLYLHDCVREEVKSSAFRNLSEDKENKWFFLKDGENILNLPDSVMNFEGSNSEITDLMIQADISQKDRYLIYGFLFLKGKSNKKKKGNEFLTPLLYIPCKLERNGVNINCTLTDETLSLNTGALSELLQCNDDEDKTEHFLDGLVEVMPELPLTNESLQIFLTTLKSIVPDIDIEKTLREYSDVENPEEPVSAKSEKLELTNMSSIILTKRPTVTAGLLHELTQISEKPSGVFRETALNIIQEEFTKSAKYDQNYTDKPFYPVVPIDLSDSQEMVLREIENNSFVSVCGPPGTGKSQTIVNLVSHLVASGKTVLVASRMDKAVDVVNERMNSLGAPFLCLRAGRANYQKQLNFHLQDLLSNKVDLDSDCESSLFACVEDLEKLFESKDNLENKAVKILEFETKWTLANKKLQEFLRNNQNFELINVSLTLSEVSNYNSAIEKVEKMMEKKGFFSSIATKMAFKALCKSLKIKEKNRSYELIQKIKIDLLANELKETVKNIEININRTGNLHVLLEDLRDLRQKHKTLSRDILKNQRRTSLKELIRDQHKRRSIMIHAKALVERKKNLQNRLLQDEDFSPMLEAFPCWAVTTYAISESLPLKPGLFDVAIIDEASQCDIASCFPVLFRAKKAVIVGDDKQLSHLSFLEKAKEQSFLSQYNIPDRYQLMWRFRTNSLFDLASFYSTNPILLDEHFRSLPPIIDFSNREFYGNRIKIINKELSLSSCMDLNVVSDAKVDLDSTRNMVEAEKVMEKLHEIINNDAKSSKKSAVSIGIISPFRGQVELLKKAVSQVLTAETVKRHQLEVGTAHTFQGDEKDIILLSFALAPNSHHQSLTFVQKPNLFNVATTRAKKQLICFISRSSETLSAGLLRNYLEYIQEFKNKNLEIIPEYYDNSASEDLAKSLKAMGMKVLTKFETAGYIIDLVVSNGNNTIAVEFDGFEEDTSVSFKNKVKKQAVLERCGWKVLRITSREWNYSSNICLEKILKNI